MKVVQVGVLPPEGNLPYLVEHAEGHVCWNT